MTGKHRDPRPSSRDRWTIVGIVTAPSTPNVNTSTGQDAADMPVVATKSRVTAPQPFPDTQGTPHTKTTTTGHTEGQP